MDEISSNLSSTGLLVITAPKTKPKTTGDFRTIPIIRETELQPPPKTYVPKKIESRNFSNLSTQNQGKSNATYQEFQKSGQKLKSLMEKFNQDDNDAIFQQQNFDTLQNLIMGAKSPNGLSSSTLKFDIPRSNQ